MAWIEPVTDRTDGSARMTYIDMNRITGNINAVRELARTEGYAVPGSDITKTLWIKNDIITKQQWLEVLDSLTTVARAVSYSYENSPDNSMYYENINIVEDITLAVYRLLAEDMDNERLNHYVGDAFANTSESYKYRYSGDPFNVGGTYNQ